ncbi:MAG: hypothetical protein RIT04_123 [Candidatus Parcubacteria bacterium]|jgi:NADH dehydrogenase
MKTIPETTRKVPHIVIVGGGFGGIYTARALEPLVKKGLADVTIINRTNYFLFTPLLHEVATGALSSHSVIEPVREILRDSNVHFIQGEVKGIDIEKKLVKLASGATGGKTPGSAIGPLAYDYLVIGSGATTNFYNIPGAEKYAFTLKSLEDATSIRNAIIKACEHAAHVTDVEERRRLLSVVIVGGGATGVELAAELIEFMRTTLCSYYHHACFDAGDMRVTLIANSSELLSQFPKKIRDIALTELKKKGIEIMLNTSVTEVHPHEIKINNTDSIATNTVVWVAGVTATQWDVNKADHTPAFEKERGNRIKTDELLRIVGHPELFALGDVSGTNPMLAQVAEQQARVVARNIAALVQNKPHRMRPYSYKEKALLVSIGQWHAAGYIYGRVFHGPLMWFFWRSIYLFKFNSWRKRFRIATEWTIDLLYPRDIASM